MHILTHTPTHPFTHSATHSPIKSTNPSTDQVGHPGGNTRASNCMLRSKFSEIKTAVILVASGRVVTLGAIVIMIMQTVTMVVVIEEG